MTLAELRETVAVMRELGVRRFGEIELDAPPRAVVDRPAPLTPAEAAKRVEEANRRILFAATGVMPREDG
jgi:hypothetical protein